MELDQIEAFLAIVRRGGFTRASSSLHLSQPAISRRIHLLEHELGAPLFERIPGGVVLTEAGRALLPHAEAVLASVRDGTAAVDALRGDSRGEVTLALVGTLASTQLTAALRRFRDAHPAVELRLRTALSAEVSALVRRGDVALGLRYQADPDPELVSTVIHDEPMLAVCSPRHRLARARRVAPGALAGERWITFPSRASAAREPYASALARGLAACGQTAAEIIPIDSLTAQKRMVEAGFGLALLPARSVDEELRTGTLCALRIPAMRTAIPIALIHRRRAFQSGATRALAALLSAWPSRARAPRRQARPRAAP
ncbi:MAG TPA: LysR family transcriptional regulator [Kofleriaceae bacterium]|nr:LysR family transcriptional regulator [Kofleriaceae bacterium]